MWLELEDETICVEQTHLLDQSHLTAEFLRTLRCISELDGNIEAGIRYS
jgi:hypothetical protein